MRCEDRTPGVWDCGRDAARPIQDDMGFCRWLCEEHGKGRKTYPLYRPVPTVLEKLAAINDKRKWWHYAYEGDAV